MRIRDLFRCEGTVSRSTYVLAGLIALALFGGFLAAKIHNVVWHGGSVSATLAVVLASVPL